MHCSGRDERMMLARKQFGQGRVSYLFWEKFRWNLNYRKSQDPILPLIQRSFPEHILWRSQVLSYIQSRTVFPCPELQ